MSSCPKCRHRIGLKTILQASSLNGTICPHCEANLRTQYWSSAVLTLVSLGAALLVGSAVRQAGAGFPFGLLALLGGFAVVYLGLAPLLLRFRVRAQSSRPGKR